MLLLGRQRIYLDADVGEITSDNIVSILEKAYAKHQQNANEMQYLINYERGIQPLQRDKAVRPEIDIRVTDNIANYIKKFHIGYFWSNPILLSQRGDKELHETNGEIDSQGISALNEMLKNGENIGFKDQCLGEFVEICGIGHRLIDVKTKSDFKNDTLFWNDRGQYVGSYVNIYNLDSRYAFCVYLNAPGQKKVLGVTFTRGSRGKLYYTCFTDKKRFEISGGKVTQEQVNPLGAIPIIEYERSFDRTGCFERSISEMDSLNILVSDFTNDVSQRTQEMWWGDNVDFKEDSSGNIEKPKSGDWVLTYSADGRTAKIQPLTSTFDSSGTLNSIETQRNWILQKNDVPIQFDSNGGGSTGVATGMYSGWSETEVAAKQKEQMVDRGKREELVLILKGISLVPSEILPIDSPIRKVHATDVEMHYERRPDYDVASQVNSFATAIAHGMHGRHALNFIKSLPDKEQTWIDSQPLIEAYQQSAFMNNAESTSVTPNERIMQDASDQTENSPILKGGE